MTRLSTRTGVVVGTLLALGGGLLAAPDLPRGGAGSLAPAVPTRAVRPAGPRGAAYVLDPVAGNPVPVASRLTEEDRLRRALEVRAIQLQLANNGGQPAPAPPPAPEATVPEGYEMLVFASARPVRIRLTLSYDGKRVGERWRAALRDAFTYFDRDGDGYLNTFEAQQGFGDLGLSQLMQSGFLSPSPQDRPSVEKLDKDGDRRLSFDEFAANYKQSARFALWAQSQVAENPANTQATQTLFKLFDTNGDGKLTRDELRAVEALVAGRDADEDECLSFAELVPNQNPGGGRVVRPPQPVPPNGMPASRTTTQLTAVYEVGKIPGTITQRVLTQYDQDKDFELTAGEVGFDEGTFARLDTDGDGRLSGEELDAWRTGPADLEVTMSLAARSPDCKVEVRTPAKTAADRGLAVRQTESSRAVIRVGRQTIDLAAIIGASTSPGASRFVLKQQFGFLFQQAAGTKNVVEEQDLAGQNGVRFQQLKVMFEPADRDGDGKLTKEEFDRYLDLQQQFADMGLALTPAIQTPTLFQLLDDNRDGRLSVRELRTAWDRLIALEPAGATEVTGSAIQPAVSLRLTRTIERNLAFQQVQFVGQPNGLPVPAPGRGPVWFRKMDRNADGDLSRAEFLGTRAEFDAIDADHDGLISLSEAEAHDKKMRAEK